MERKKIRWTSKEELFLTKNVHLGAAELSKRLKKTPESIYKKAKRLNISIYTRDKETQASDTNNKLNNENQLELLATAIVNADSWPPRRWMAKYGDINIAIPSHLNNDYRNIRKSMLAKIPKQPFQESMNGFEEHSIVL